MGLGILGLAGVGSKKGERGFGKSLLGNLGALVGVGNPTQSPGELFSRGSGPLPGLSGLFGGGLTPLSGLSVARGLIDQSFGAKPAASAPDSTPSGLDQFNSALGDLGLTPELQEEVLRLAAERLSAVSQG